MGLHGGGRTDYVSYRLHDGHGHWKPGGMGSIFSFKFFTFGQPLSYVHTGHDLLAAHVVESDESGCLWTFYAPVA